MREARDDAGIVHQHIEAAMMGHDLAHQPTGLLDLGEVDLVIAGAGQLRCHRLPKFGLATAVQRHLVAVA